MQVHWHTFSVSTLGEVINFQFDARQKLAKYIVASIDVNGTLIGHSQCFKYLGVLLVMFLSVEEYVKYK